MMLGHTAVTTQGMTLQELHDFLDQCDLAEIPREHVPTVRITFHGKIKKVQVDHR